MSAVNNERSYTKYSEARRPQDENLEVFLFYAFSKSVNGFILPLTDSVNKGDSQ